MSAPIQPYEFLGLDASVSDPRLVRQAYYRLALICHPDKGGHPDAMTTLTLAYQWVMDGLRHADAHRQSFEEYYTDFNLQTKVQHFSEVLAESFDYTPARFEAFATGSPYHLSIAEAEMLRVRAFEYALYKDATPETLETHLHTFLETYKADAQNRVGSSNMYVSMTEEKGYGDRMSLSDLRPEDYVRIHPNRGSTTSDALMSPDRTIVSYIDPTAHPSATFTQLVAPLPMYDYEEAFQTYSLDGIPELSNGEVRVLPITPSIFTQQMTEKALEREFQDQNIGL